MTYQVADLFAWDPVQPLDPAFAACWLSHLPAERLAPLLAMRRRMAHRGGQRCVIDEPDSSPARPPPAERASPPASREMRLLHDRS